MRRANVDTNEGLRFWFVVFVVVGLAACSNGSGSLEDPNAPPSGEQPPPTTPPPTPDPTEPATPGAGLAGYWKGTAAEGNKPAHEAVAMIDHTGQTQLMVLAAANDSDPQFVLHGNLCCASSTEDDEVPSKRFLFNRDEQAELRITRSATTLSGTMQFRGHEYALDLTFSSEYKTALTLQSLAGVYTQSLGTSTLTLSIDANGRLTGSHTNGCVFNGLVSIPEATRNMVELSYELSGCGDGGSLRSWNGEYSGVGMLLRNSAMPGTPSNADVFYHSTVGPTWLGPQSVGR